MTIMCAVNATMDTLYLPMELAVRIIALVKTVYYVIPKILFVSFVAQAPIKNHCIILFVRHSLPITQDATLMDANSVSHLLSANNVLLSLA